MKALRRRHGVNYGGVLFMLGRLLIALALALAIPGLLAHFTASPGRSPFLVAAALALIGGIGLERGFNQGDDFSFGRREAFLLVSSAWLVSTFAGALPFVLEFGPLFFIDALFESALGLHDDRRVHLYGCGESAGRLPALAGADSVDRWHGHHRSRHCRSTKARRRGHGASRCRGAGVATFLPSGSRMSILTSRAMPPSWHGVNS